MGAMDEWVNDPEPKHNPIRHDLLAVGAILLLIDIDDVAEKIDQRLRSEDYLR